MSIRVCQVVACINELTGGPAYSVSGLSASLSEHGILTHLLTLDYRDLGRQLCPRNVTMHSYPASFITKFFRGIQSDASRGLDELASQKLDLIHNHGLWMRPNFYARHAAARHCLPLVTSPRGMLEPWSIGYSQMKKAVAWYFYEWKNLARANVFHATSSAEAESIRRLGFKQPIAIVKNGIDVPDLSGITPSGILVQKFPELRGKKWVLSLSRIHPKKGFDNLLIVWQDLVRQFTDLHLLIAGPDIIGYEKELKRVVMELGLKERVTFTGSLSGTLKEAALAHADLFVLPSHSENFGLVIGESLAHGVPVVTTRETPWQDLETFKCGWWVEDSREALKRALTSAMNLTAGERKQMGLNGRSLIKKKYSWREAGHQVAAVYRWILGGGPAPDCVQVVG